jgi:hypothetical protein
MIDLGKFIARISDLNHFLGLSIFLSTRANVFIVMLSLKMTTKNKCMNWMPVVYAYNPSYSGGRDQEPAQA